MECQITISEMQKGMIFHTIHSDLKSIYIVQKILFFDELILCDVMQTTWNEIPHRHPNMRAYFQNFSKEDISLDFSENVTININHLTYANCDDQIFSEHYEKFLLEDSQQQFDLSSPPLMRVSILSNSNKSILIWSYHHTLLAGPSSLQILEEVLLTYQALCRGEHFKLNPCQKLTITHQNISAAMQNVDAEKYWKKQLQGYTQEAPLPQDYTLTNQKKIPLRQSRYDFKISAELTSKLITAAKAESLSITTFIHAAWALLLARYTFCDDIVFGAVRAYPKDLVGDSVGLFINTLPLRIKIENQTIGEFKHELRQQYLAFRNYVTTPLREIKKWCDLSPQTALFNTSIDFKYRSINDEMRARFQDWGNKKLIQRFDIDLPLSLEIFLDQNNVQIEVNYDSNRFTKKFLTRMGKHFTNILYGLLDCNDNSIHSIQMLSDDEYPLTNLKCHSKEQAFSTNNNIITHIHNTSVENPTGLALTFKNKSLTFLQQNIQSNQLAHYLLNHYHEALSKSKRVAVYLLPGIDRIIAIWSILKLGAAYIPLEVDNPIERNQFIIKDSDSAFILSNTTTIQTKPFNTGSSKKIILLNEIENAVTQSDQSNLSIKIQPNDLAYIIYTSGSTGHPKGVMIKHIGLLNRLIWMKNYFHFTDCETFIHKTPYGFDVSVWEILLPVITQSKLALIEADGHKDFPYLCNRIQDQKVTCIHFVPSMLQAFINYLQENNALIDKLSSLQKVICSGETLPTSLAETCSNLLAVDVYNLYGPTEASIDVSFFHYQTGSIKSQSVPIGKPIDHTRLYILDRHLNLLPKNIAGELYISSVGVADGYVNLPELTKQCFIENPFIYDDDPLYYSKMYKTGDLARYLDDGNIEYLSRIDHQIKINGVRIELDEISNTLKDCPEVADAIVIYKQVISDTKQLIAYYVLQNNDETTFIDKKEKLSAWSTIFDQYYGDDADADAINTFNIDGWISSYTGQPIDYNAMHEWVDRAVDRINAGPNDRILELGCGTGLLLYPLSQKCLSYKGIDISNNAVVNCQRGAKQLGLKNVEVMMSAVDTFLEKCPPKSRFSKILLNSVIQYFPHIDYLEIILKNSLSFIDQGSIFIGDVRDYRLLNTFYLSLYLHKEKNENIDNIKEYMHHKKLNESELSLAPEFFLQFALKHKKISRIELLPKRGNHINEMNLFRYDVIMHINEQASQHTINKPRWISWHNSPLDLKSQLTLDQDYVYIRAYPNKNVWIEYYLQDYINQGGLNFNEKLQLLKHECNYFLSQDDIEKLAEEQSYKVNFYINTSLHDAPAYLDCIFYRQDLTDYPLYNGLESSFDPQTNLSNTSLLHKQSVRKHLQKFVESRLPRSMHPNFYHELSSMPLNVSGKIDRKNLPNIFHNKNNKDFISASTDEEISLSKIWQKILRLDRISIQDDFFELGGDSIMMIQAYSMIRDAGFSITPKEIFANPTIQKLSQVISREISDDHDSIQPASGDTPLTPIQQYFFSHKHKAINYYNQCYLLSLAPKIQYEFVEEALNHILHYHDSFRLRFQRNALSWDQTYSDHSTHHQIKSIDFSQISSDNHKDLLFKYATQIQEEINISKGPIVVALHIQNYNHCENLLFIAIHHLVIDTVSFLILLDDFESALQALYTKLPIKLKRKTNSYQDWSRYLQDNTHSFQYKPYWQAVLEGYQQQFTINLPSLLPYESFTTETLQLNQFETESLALSVKKTAQISMQKILLTYLILSIYELSSSKELLIHLESYGRASDAENLDLTRSIGWFTSIFPVRFCFQTIKNTFSEIFKLVDDTLAKIPDLGISYGDLLYLKKDQQLTHLATHNPVELLFNYHGNIGDMLSNYEQFSLKPIDAIQKVSPRNHTPHPIEINAMIQDDCLNIKFSYYKHPQIIQFVQSVMKNFKILCKAHKDHNCNISLNSTGEASDQQTAEYYFINQKSHTNYQAILTFNDTGSLTPLFFVHPVAAGAEIYNKFASFLSRDIPFYAIDYHNLHLGEPFIANIEALATQYIKYLRTIKPHGPYKLGGWSFGAIVAYEMAVQLEHDGELVESLYLIDHMPKRLHDPQTGMVKTLTRSLFSKTITNIKQFRDEVLPIELRAVFDGMSQSFKEHFIRVHATSSQAVRDYIASPYSKKIILIKPSKSRRYHGLSDQKLMQRLLPQLNVINLQTDHFGLIQDEVCIKKIANIILQD